MGQGVKINQYSLVLLSTLIIIAFQLPPYIHKFPLKIQDYIYYATLYFGSDQQKISVLVDSGSRTLATFCDLCQHGCVVNQQFLTVKSNSFQNVTCSQIIRIIDQSISSPALRNCNSQCFQYSSNKNDYQCKGQLNYGSSSLASFLDYLLIRDTISTQNNGYKVFSTFGCIYDERNFDTGIWGVSLAADNQFLQEIHQNDLANNLTGAQRLFTICTTGSFAVMNIGGVDSSGHIGDGYSMRVNPSMNIWWNINTDDLGEIIYLNENITIRQNDDSFGKYGVILDTGTDFNIFPTQIYNSFTSMVVKRCAQQPNNCLQVQEYQIFYTVFILNDPNTFFANQTITFKIGGKILQTPLSNYFWNLGHGAWALGMVSAQQFNFQMSILGSIWMNNFDVSFDRQNNKITIYDVSTCSGSTRRLQTEDDDDSQYQLPAARKNRMDGNQAIHKLRVKLQKGLQKMENKNR